MISILLHIIEKDNQSEKSAFYQWTAGVLGNYPITQNEFAFVESLMPFTVFDETIRGAVKVLIKLELGDSRK